MSGLRLLALETSSATATIALADGDAVAEQTIETQRAQAGRVLECVDELLAAAGVGPGDLDAIVFGQGPGSFTGLRIAAAVAQGLCLASGRPIVAVSSLAALAQRGLGEQHSLGAQQGLPTQPGTAAPGAVTTALCCVDARMGEVYWGCYRLVDGLSAAIGEERIGPPDTVAIDRADAAMAGGYLALGDGLAACPEALAGVIAGALACDSALVPRARDLLPIAAARVAAGQFVPLAAALPVYLRNADAWRRA